MTFDDQIDCTLLTAKITIMIPNSEHSTIAFGISTVHTWVFASSKL